MKKVLGSDRSTSPGRKLTPGVALCCAGEGEEEEEEEGESDDSRLEGSAVVIARSADSCLDISFYWSQRVYREKSPSVFHGDSKITSAIGSFSRKLPRAATPYSATRTSMAGSPGKKPSKGWGLSFLFSFFFGGGKRLPTDPFLVRSRPSRHPGQLDSTCTCRRPQAPLRFPKSAP